MIYKNKINKMSVPQNMQSNLSKEIPSDTDLENFKLLARGTGIDEKEFYIITHSANDCLKKKLSPLSDSIINKVKKILGGEWFAFAMIEGAKGFDFSLSVVTGNDFLCFTIDNFKFQVCRLRD